jgi:hypothetical protein
MSANALSSDCLLPAAHLFNHKKDLMGLEKGFIYLMKIMNIKDLGIYEKRRHQRTR